MKEQTKSIIIVCEGQSEVAYLQELNRLLTENHVGIIFIPKNAGGGQYGQISKRFRAEKKVNPRSSICIWADYDIYQRNDNGTMSAYNKKPKGIPDFYFNYQNFEDFLVLHLPHDTIHAWQSTCLGNNHFSLPLCAEEYMELLHLHNWPDYKKGEMPFSLSVKNLKRLFVNNNDKQILFSSDFASWLEKHLEGN